jgi:signal transduction histidine kinase
MAYLVFVSQHKHKTGVEPGNDKPEKPISKSVVKKFKRGIIFRKILVILIFLSLIPVIFSSFLIISSYQEAIGFLQERGVSVSAEIEELRQNVLIQISLVLFLLVILVLFAGILIARSITRPLSILARGVQEVAEGDLSIRFKVKSKDELGELAAAFNEMIEKLKEQREREQLVARLKTEFISIAAHQLRTPLSSVKWILNMFIDGDFGQLTEKQKEFVEKGYEANDRMIHLVNDLLDATRIEEGRFGFEFSLNNFSEFLTETIGYSDEDAKIRDIKLTVSVPETPIEMVFDPQRLKMAVTNLVDNAIRYTPRSGKVSVLAKKMGDFVKVIVQDSGVGIPKHQKDRVFSKFFRADNVVRMQTEGTGLGLYLTKNIIEKHGGKIWFESEENKGTAFHFTIPYTKEEEPE